MRSPQALRPVDAQTLLESLPPPWPDGSLRAAAAAYLATTRQCIVALDDDPTGNQTVHDVWVLTRWEVDDIRRALEDGDPALYILTNSRSLTEAEAVTRTREVVRNIGVAAAETGRPVTLVSRSDSTLRGHFPAEVEAMIDEWTRHVGKKPDGVCIIPAFPEGGRLTIHDVHWVAEGNQLIPAGQTPYAADAVFGYQASHLAQWIHEKTHGRVPIDAVLSIDLMTIRKGGPAAVANLLRGASDGRMVVVNAADYRDLDVFVAGWRILEEAGQSLLFRTAASFVKTAAGLSDQPLLSGAALTAGRPSSGGLIVFGSHVPKSTAQLERLLLLDNIFAIELDIARVLDAATRTPEIARVATELDQALATGQDALVFTPRQVWTGNSASESLQIARTVSAALMQAVRQIKTEPRFVIGKGGITSSDLATDGLQVRAARVAGQILPGVPVWQPGDDSHWPNVPLVVFPGNVGNDDAVADVVRALRSN